MRERAAALAARAVLAGALAGAMAGGAVAQDRPAAQGGRAGLVVEPSLGLALTATDNYRVSAGTDRAELVTTVSPGLRISSRSGRVQGSVDYALTGVVHARESADNRVQNRLAAAVRAEAVPDHLDIGLTGNISRQAVSALQRQAADGTLSERNQAEVRSFSVQPVLRGQPGGLVALRAEARLSRDSSSEQVGATGRTYGLTLSSPDSGARLAWVASGLRAVSDFDGGRETTVDRLILGLSVRPDIEWLLSVRGGRERTDIASVERKTYDNWGAGALWTPGPRTRVAADYDRRYYGNAWNVSAEHRMRRTVLRYTHARSATDSVGLRAGASISAYDLFYQLFASQEPDPIAREALVRAFLERNGIAPDLLLSGGGFLSSAVSVQQRQEFSVAVNGVRTSVLASAYDTRSERGDTVSGAADDLAAGALRQQGLNLTLTHRLTPRDSLSLGGAVQRSRSLATDQRNRLASVSLGWTTRLSDRASFSLLLRHSDQDASLATEDYTENALSAAFRTRF